MHFESLQNKKNRKNGAPNSFTGQEQDKEHVLGVLHNKRKGGRAKLKSRKGAARGTKKALKQTERGGGMDRLKGNKNSG